MKLEEFLQKKYNYNPDVKNAIKTYIDQWNSWYEGNVKSFHNYFIYNGQKKVNKTRFTLNMAKEISEDWSDILWSEKCKISMKDDNSQNEFDKLLDELDLNTIINQTLEKSGALGTSATVISVYDIIKNEDKMILDVSKAKTRIDIVDVDDVYPLSWDNKGTTECAFSSAKYIGGIKYIMLSVHKIDEKSGNYVIYNHLFKEDKDNIIEVEQDEKTLTEFDTESNIPWFRLFEPLLTNNLFKNSPFGISHFANAIDVLKTVDIDFDEFKNEVKNGRKRTFVSADMLTFEDGKQKLVFDPNDTDLYVLPKGANKDDFIQSDTENIRVNEQIAALNTSLNILGNKVGFGENHYHFDGTNLSTATAVISSNSKMARRMKKLQIGYESAIYDLIKAVCYASTKFGQYNINTENMAISFDDSIIEDKESESVRALREYQSGIISGPEYRMRVFGETEEIATQKFNEVQLAAASTEELMKEE